MMENLSSVNLEPQFQGEFSINLLNNSMEIASIFCVLIESIFCCIAADINEIQQEEEKAQEAKLHPRYLLYNISLKILR